MQDHLKERLTGAAILVIVVVLLVPELFRGRPTANLKPGSGAIAGPPLRSYTIDLRDTAAAQPPGASAPVVTSPASTAASAPANVAINAAAISAAPPPIAAPAIPAAAATPPSQHAGTAKSGWTVQVGTFLRRDYAEHMVKQVSAKGYTVEVAGPDNRGLYRVRSAPQAERAAALALKQKMLASGLKPIVNTAP